MPTDSIVEINGQNSFMELDADVKVLLYALIEPALMAMMDIVDMLAIVGDSQLLLIQSPVGVEGRELDFVLER